MRFWFGVRLMEVCLDMLSAMPALRPDADSENGAGDRV